MSDQIAHLLGGGVLICAFAMLAQRRVAGMISLYRVQALMLALAAFGRGNFDLYLTGASILLINAVVLPVALRRMAARFARDGAVGTAMPMGILLAIGGALIGVAVAVVPERADLAISLSVVLLGLLVMVAGRRAMSRIIGVLTVANGLMLTAIGMPGMPFVAALPLALLVLMAFPALVFFGARRAP